MMTPAPTPLSTSWSVKTPRQWRLYRDGRGIPWGKDGVVKGDRVTRLGVEQRPAQRARARIGSARDDYGRASLMCHSRGRLLSTCRCT
jgi:hypothetical protein